MGDQHLADEQMEDEQDTIGELDNGDFIDDQEGGGGEVGFWALIGGLLLLALAGGVALGVYVIPAGILPGDDDYQSALDVANQRLDELDAIAGVQAQLEGSISTTIAEADAQTEDVDLELANTLPALIYTVSASNVGTCADYVGFDVNGTLRSFRMAEPYPC